MNYSCGLCGHKVTLLTSPTKLVACPNCIGGYLTVNGNPVADTTIRTTLSPAKREVADNHQAS